MRFEPGPLAEVQSRHDDDGWTLEFAIDLPHPPQEVWNALTDPAQLVSWAPFTADRSLACTGDAVLTMIDGETAVELPIEVQRAERPTRLEYTWGADRLRWELAPAGAGTRLILRHTVAGPDQLAKVAAGWHLCLLVARRLLDGAPMAPIRGKGAMNFGWRELNDEYKKIIDREE
jgi:uncharacterized protein YndB with AHSA1/START domain